MAITDLKSFICWGLKPRQTSAIIALTCASLLAGAYTFEYFVGLHPCPLCLWERIPHWAGLVLALPAAILWHKGKCIPAVSLQILAVIAMAVSTGLAGFHVGVEFEWWDAGCMGNLAADFNEDLLAMLDSAPLADCKDPAWSLFGISMAGYNFLISLGLLAVGFMSLIIAWINRHQQA